MKRFIPFLLIFPLIAGACAQPSPDLATFLETDKTDEIPYADGFKCLEFAEELYFNAQEEGLKVGIVFVFLENSYQDKKYHALNVFDTDEGFVFVDCSTGRDAIASVEIGKPYSTLYSETTNGGSSTIASKGRKITDYKIIWEH